MDRISHASRTGSVMNGAVAFVASTLPFQQIARYHRELGLIEVVCAGPLLASSYTKGFARLGLNLAVSGLTGSTRSSSIQLLYRLLRAKEVVIFHECCWFQIDFLILLSCRRVRFFPTIAVSGRKKIAARDLPIKNRLRGFLMSRWFDIYETPMDGGEDVYYVFAVKERFRKTDPDRAMSGLVSPAAGNPNRKRKPAVLVLCSQDQVPHKVLRDLYARIVAQLASDGVEVHVKDHPNPEMRLHISDTGANEIDASLPLECLDLSIYTAFVSIASASVAAGRNFGEIISIAKLLPDAYQEKLDVRLKYLETLGLTPRTPRSVDELIDIVTKRPEA